MSDETTHPARELLRDHAAGRLEERRRGEVTAHLEHCARCRHAAAVEAELTGALNRLPARAAPPALRRRLEALGDPASSPVAVEVPPRSAPGTARRLLPN